MSNIVEILEVRIVCCIFTIGSTLQDFLSIKHGNEQDMRKDRQHAVHSLSFDEAADTSCKALLKPQPSLFVRVHADLQVGPEDEDEEDGAAADIDAQRKGKCVVLKTSTRQTIFLPVRYPISMFAWAGYTAVTASRAVTECFIHDGCAGCRTCGPKNTEARRFGGRQQRQLPSAGHPAGRI